MSEYLSRKEIAAKTGLSYAIVRTNEKRLGIASSKVKMNPRLILYRKPEALAGLAKKGFLKE